MKATGYIKGLFGATALYAASPAIEVGVIDRARASVGSIAAGENLFDHKAPYLINHMTLAYALTADGLHISDPFNYWKARFDGETCLTEKNGLKYHGAATWSVEDNAKCLSRMTGVKVEYLQPDPNDTFAYCSHKNRIGEEARVVWDHKAGTSECVVTPSGMGE